LVFVSCHRKENRAVDRLAILAFENLSADASLDWVGPAVAGMLAEQVSASTNKYPYRVNNLREARLTGATQVVQGYYAVSNNRLEIHGVVEDLRSRRNLQEAISNARPGGDLSSAAAAMAHAIESRTRPFGTQNAVAIRAWGQSQVAEGGPQRVEALKRALVADPNFGEAYAELIRVYAAMGDSAGVQSTLKQADDRLSQFTDLERARVELIASQVRGNEAQRRSSLMALSRLVSTDVQAIEGIAQSELAARRFNSAVDFFKSAVAIQPDNPVLLNQLGYTEAYRGNLDGAREVLERYRTLQPGQANALDSLGEVHFFAGRFADAAKYFLDAARIQPNLLGGVEVLKAAQAKYMQGNLTEADQVYGRWDKLHRDSRDPAADLRKAQWLYITGRRAEAIKAAELAAADANPEVAAYALCHLALWSMDAGDRAKASDFAARAAQSAHGSVAQIAALCRYIVDLPPQPEGQRIPDIARAYAALFAGHPADAIPLLKPLYEKSSPTSDANLRILYAWALSGAARRDEARPLLDRYPIPLGAADDVLFMTQLFPRFLALRSAIVGSTATLARPS
jgi:Tfp pilus assembly protein PilF